MDAKLPVNKKRVNKRPGMFQPIGVIGEIRHGTALASRPRERVAPGLPMVQASNWTSKRKKTPLQHVKNIERTLRAILLHVAPWVPGTD